MKAYASGLGFEPSPRWLTLFESADIPEFVKGFGRTGSNNAVLAEQMKAIYARVGRWTVTAAWNDKARSPGFHVGLRRKGEKELLDKPVTSGGCAFYMGTPLAWYYELTGEQIFLDRLKEMAGQAGLAQRAKKDLGNWSYALYLAQGGKIPGRPMPAGSAPPVRQQPAPRSAR